MSRSFSIFFLTSIGLAFGALQADAQMQLQGQSQYGGLLRNVNSGKCIDVFGGSTSKNAIFLQWRWEPTLGIYLCW